MGDQVAFENAISSLESQIANVGTHLTVDSSARVAYSREIRLKAEGKSLNELVALHTARAHGKDAVFAQLATPQKNAIYASIVTSAGKSNAAVTKAMSRLSFAGKGILGLSLALSAYTIATSDNKVAATHKEAATLGASIAGGLAGGAMAGLACGPGAPACVTVGAFVGGALAAFGISSFW